MKKAKRWRFLPCLLLAACFAGCTPEPPAEPAPAPEAVWVGPLREGTVQTVLPAPDDLMEKQRHAAYMQGMDGQFRPEALLTRAQTAQLLVNLFGGGRVSEFSDVAEDAWYYDSVTSAASSLPGYADGSFRPDAPITPLEFLRAVERAAGESLDPPGFTVLRGVTAPAFPADAVTFALGDTVTRAEAAVMLNRSLERQPDREIIDLLTEKAFSDVEKDHPRYYEIMEAAKTHECTREEGVEKWDKDSVIKKRRYYRPSAPAAAAVPTVTATAIEEVLELDLTKYRSSGNAEIDSYVAAVLAACTNDDMATWEKLRACYNYVRSYRYLGRNAVLSRDHKSIPGENAVAYAAKIFATGKGDCYNFASAFYFLARALGYNATTVVGSCSYSWGTVAHGWVEIDLGGVVYLYDPQIENYNDRCGISNSTHSAYQVTYETSPGRYYKN